MSDDRRSRYELLAAEQRERIARGLPASVELSQKMQAIFLELFTRSEELIRLEHEFGVRVEVKKENVQ